MKTLLHFWKTRGLRQQFIFIISLSLFTISLVFLLLFVQVYHYQLAQERSVASDNVNRLLQASLENAMLKQDLAGLRHIIERLGEQADIRKAFIINPMQEVRFSSQSHELGQQLKTLPSLDVERYVDLAQPVTQFMINEEGHEVLRSINPVHNKPTCLQCHGSVKDNPINGVLFVDYDAGTIRQRAVQGGWLLMGAGSIVVLFAISIIVFFIHRAILKPIQHLANASRAIANGKLDTRINTICQNELGTLAHTFNHMAANLQKSLQEVEEQKQFLQSLIDAIPDGIRVINQDFKIVTANRAYHQQLNLQEGSSVQQFCYTSSHQTQQPCPPTLITCPVHEIKKKLQPIKTVMTHHTQEGNNFPVEVCSAPMQVMHHGKKALLIVESIRDLRQTIAFSHEQKLSALGQLAAGVAHEIYNPLSSIRLALQSTLRDLTTPQPPINEINEYLQLVDRQIDKCIEVTQRLLKLSSSSSEAMTLLNLETIVHDTVELLHFEGEQNGVTIKIAADDTYAVFAIESDMRMLVLNLLQNAFHAMPNGGAVNITLEKDEKHIYFTIADTGVGIAEEIKHHIFDPFFSRRANSQFGTGLGLAICKSIMDRHRGTIEGQNRVDKGAIFNVVLPAPDFDNE